MPDIDNHHNTIVLGRLFAAQTMLESLPDEASIISFLTEALKTCPGVDTVSIFLSATALSIPDVDETSLSHCFPMHGHNGLLGRLKLTGDRSDRLPIYLPYIGNLVAAAAMTIDNRRLLATLREENRQLYASLISNIPGAIFRILPPQGDVCLFISAEIEKISGHPPAEFIAGSCSLNKLAIAEDRAVRNGIATGSAYDFEYRIRHLDGSIRWVHERGRSVAGADGVIERIDGMLFDISGRKRMEASMQLAALVYENSSEAMLVTDEKNIILSVNQAFTRITGYTAEEVIGRTPRLLKSGRHDNMFYRNMWRSIVETGSWRGEVWNRRKNGEIFAEYLAINTIYNADGTPQRHVALAADVTERIRNEEQIWRHTHFDPLTGLLNRRAFNQRLSQEIKKSSRGGSSLALLYIDLDRFKDINDTRGYETGDELLQETARRLTACTDESEAIARVGGDEFIVILKNLNTPAMLEQVAAKLFRALRKPYNLGGEPTYISASIGMTVHPDDGADPAVLLKNAEQAMYAAKQSGRNCYRYFTASLQEAVQLRARLAHDLHQALPAGEFLLYYQPIVELASGRIHKAEALLRWNHPLHGFISPAVFIPVAEDSGAIHEIGDWVFREAARQTLRWRQLYDHDFQTSINKSPVQFRDRSRSANDWPVFLRQLGLDGTAIVIEITEGVLLSPAGNVNEKLLRFKDIGIEIAIDDFGTGYSSLAYLKELDVDYLKIDQSFTRNLAPDSNDLALSEAIVVMAHKLGLKVIAEGVETQQQRDLLIRIGCDYAQGYLFSTPLPPDAFEALLNSETGYPAL